MIEIQSPENRFMLSQYEEKMIHLRVKQKMVEEELKSVEHEITECTRKIREWFILWENEVLDKTSRENRKQKSVTDNAERQIKVIEELVKKDKEEIAALKDKEKVQKRLEEW